MHSSIDPPHAFLKRAWAVTPRVPASMDDQTLFDRQYASLREFCRLLGSAAPGARVVELDGVLAAVVPATPDRSVMNSVVYEDAGRLERALPELAAAYEAAGVRAWTVWVPHDDAEAAGFWTGPGTCSTPTRRRWHGAERLEAPRPDDLDLDPDAGSATVARLNDLAYAYGGDHFERPCAPPVAALLRRADRRAPGGCATGHDHDGDFWVTLVATLPGGARPGPRRPGCWPRAARGARPGVHDHQPAGDEDGPPGLRAARLPRPGRGADVGAPRRGVGMAIVYRIRHHSDDETAKRSPGEGGSVTLHPVRRPRIRLVSH